MEEEPDFFSEHVCTPKPHKIKLTAWNATSSVPTGTAIEFTLHRILPEENQHFCGTFVIMSSICVTSVPIACACGSPAQTSTSQLNFQVFSIHSERWKTTFSHKPLKATNYTQ